MFFSNNGIENWENNDAKSKSKLNDMLLQYCSAKI